MNTWKIVFQRLSSSGTYLAKWFITPSGGAILMYVPKLQEIGDNRFLGDRNPDGEGSTMHYADIEKIEIEAEFKYGNFIGRHDINKIIEILSSVRGIRISNTGKSVIIELSEDHS